MTPPLITATLVAASAISLAVRLALDPDLFAPSSATVIALGAVLFAIIAVAGLMLVRGRWSRRLAAALGVGCACVAAVLEPDAWSIVSIVTGLGAVAMTAGRWLDGWIRARPSALGPPPEAVVVLMGLLTIVPAVGIASPAGLETAHGVLGAAALFLAWAFGKAQIWSLWAIRLVLPVLGILVALVSPAAGAALLLALVGGIVAIAWTTPVRLAVQPLLDELPGPRRPGSGRGDAGA